MFCANLNCRLEAFDLQLGTLRLVEMEVPPDERTIRSDWGFPICSVPSRYFWLCAECTRLYSIKQWTPAGLVLEPRLHTHTVKRKARVIKIPVVAALHREMQIMHRKFA
jgi:hypothetical protein